MTIGMRRETHEENSLLKERHRIVQLRAPASRRRMPQRKERTTGRVSRQRRGKREDARADIRQGDRRNEEDNRTNAKRSIENKQDTNCQQATL